jgi:hypothetical protein
MNRQEKIELMCDVGDEILLLFKDKGYFDFALLQLDNEEELIYTPKAQDLFNAIYDILDSKIKNNE